MQLVKRLRPENGFTALPVVFTMFVILACVVWLTQDVGSADIVLKDSVTNATQAATEQFDGQGRINYTEARAAFTQLLEQNCQLDDTLQAMPHSPFLGHADYTLIVYNGSTENDGPPGVIFTYTHGVCSREPVSQIGFPANFDLSGGIRVTLQSPGSISEVSIRPQNIFPRKEMYTRWAASHLVKLNGNWVVLMQGQSG